MPRVPHLAHEFCESINTKFYWPEYNSKLLENDNCKIVIQVDGRKRGILEVQKNLEEKMIINKSKEVVNVLKHIENVKIVKNIYVKNRLVNFITKK